MVIGELPSDKRNKQSSLPTHTIVRNSMNMRNTLWVNFQELIHSSIQESSTLTEPSISANPSRISSSSQASTATATLLPITSSVLKQMPGARPPTNVPRT